MILGLRYSEMLSVLRTHADGANPDSARIEAVQKEGGRPAFS